MIMILFYCQPRLASLQSWIDQAAYVSLPGFLRQSFSHASTWWISSAALLPLLRWMR
jgi:hypothetical protein